MEQHPRDGLGPRAAPSQALGPPWGSLTSLHPHFGFSVQSKLCVSCISDTSHAHFVL